MNFPILMNDEQLDALSAKYPDMEEIISFRGSVGAFYQRFAAPFLAPSESRKERLISAITAAAGEVFSEEEVQSIASSLRTNYLVSTAEHHASISYAQSFNVALNQFLIQRRHRLPLISLACATTTLDNELFPRGVFYANEKLPFLTKSHKNLFASYAPPIHKEVFYSRVKELQRNAVIDASEAAFLNTWFEQEMAVLEVWNELSLQLSVLNKRLWKAMVHEELQYQGCNYFMIPIEVVVEHLLRAEFTCEEKSWVYLCLFEQEQRSRLLHALHKTRLCWDLDARKGTFLFWGYNERGRPVQLFLQGDALVAHSCSLQIPLTPSAINTALQARQIVPAGSLCCLYLAFYAGLTLMGGLLQVNYLSEMQRRLVTDNPLALPDGDLAIMAAVKTNLYVNFQELAWNAGGLKKTTNKLTAADLNAFEQCDHFAQLQECLVWLSHV